MNGEIRRIAVFRALMLGDLLCVVPALRALRGAYLNAQITLIGLPWARTFVTRFSDYLDDFIEFPGYPGLPEREPEITGFTRFLHEAQNRRFDLAIQLHGSGHIVNPITSLLDARNTAGFFVPGEWKPNDEMFLEYPKNETEIWRFLRLMEFLGIPLDGDHLEFPIGESDMLDFLKIDECGQLLGPDYICIHPGARFLSRRWAPQKFADVADRLAAEGLRIVLTGTSAERDLTCAVSDAMRSTPIDLAGKTSLGALGVLLKHSRLLISNDTGVSHVAAATNTPSVVIVLGSDPDRWQMYDASRHRVVYEEISCRPCEFVDCPIGHLCSDAVTPDRVFIEAMRLLAPTSVIGAYAN